MFSEAHFRFQSLSPTSMVVPKERRLIHETNQRLGRAVSVSRFRVKSGVETTPVLSKNN